MLLCTGKIGQELRMERKKLKMPGPAIVSLEQMYPFPEAEVAEVLGLYKNATEFIWVQEEPANMGALSFVTPRLKRILGSKVRSIKRAPNCHAGNRLGEGARTGAEDADHAGAGQGGVEADDEACTRLRTSGYRSARSRCLSPAAALLIVFASA